MFMSLARFMSIGVLALCASFLYGCAKPWPESPLYDFPVNDPDWTPPDTLADAMAAAEGHYAHYDIVAYEGETPNGPLYSFIISYGFTDLVIEGDKLVEYDRFCHAEYEANQNMKVIFDDAATQAIQPRTAVVELTKKNGEWVGWRPPTPTLIGIDGDPDVPLSMDPNDPKINDDDGDGKPGVTVQMKLFGVIDAEVYIARREIFQGYVKLYSDGSVRGDVIDHSEQMVIGATEEFLNVPNNPSQHEDLGLSPVILIPVSNDLDSCEELMAKRDELFPKAPKF